MNTIKQQLEARLAAMREENEVLASALSDSVKLTDYAPKNGVWTEAFQKALDEHEIVVIPAAEEPYVLDNSIIIPSDRKIIAEEGAVIRLGEDVKVLMMRNSNTVDGTHMPIKGVERNRNITFIGGTWEESCTTRLGYGNSGKYDEARSLYGVSTCLFLENLDHLTMKNMTFRNCGGFAVQIGEISNVYIENIRFINCFADGIHVNGNTDNLHIRDVSGQVGDDLVALNMYDWQNSTVNFGPCNNVLCEDLELDANARYKAFRIQAGIYYFDDGSTVDCSLNNAVLRRIKGIKTFKMYYQTPSYKVYEEPERGGVGSGDNIIFEDIDIDLVSPMDGFENYEQGDPVTGAFAGFELGLNVKNLYFKDISIKLYRDKYPTAYLACIGPRSVRIDDVEIFDPYVSSHADMMYLENIKINGENPDDIRPYVREIVFDHLYPDGPSTGSGTIGKLVYKK